MSEKALELQFLSRGADDAAVASILRLSISIFRSFNTEPDSHRASLEVWKERLSDPASSIVYLVPSEPDQFPPSSSSLSSSSEDDQPNSNSPVPPPPVPVGFIFAYPRSHPEPLKNGSSQSLHIWLAGVLEEYRGRGSLDTMVNALIDLERKRWGSDPSLMPTFTVCTNPSMFPSMWAWVRARKRWVLEKEFDEGKVMFSLTGRYNA